MVQPIEMAARMATRTARVGWYYGVNRLLARRFGEASKTGKAADRSHHAVPERAELFGALRRLLMEDAADCAKGINPGDELSARALPGHIGRLRGMLKDLPSTIDRRKAGVFDTAKDHATKTSAAGAEFPDYYTQDFHFQTGGHLTSDSARIYDVQVETLFYGAGDAMRRAAFRPLADYTRGRDQRRVSLVDVACGTGRFLRMVRRQYPRMQLTGIDLSPTYLAEAESHLDDLRAVNWLQANAETMPLAAESQDVAISIFLFHELPAQARQAVLHDVARILKPDGLFVLIDSLQYGDEAGWDGLLEAFPQRFHEPYYRHYLIDDLERRGRAAGLSPVETRNVFLSKVMVFRKVGAAGNP